MTAPFMEITFPDRYDYAASFADKKLGDIETANIPDGKKLALYALRKQVEVGPCNEAAPYMWNVKERYKHQAWESLKSVSKFEAMVKYVELLEDPEIIGPQWLEEAVGGSPGATGGDDTSFPLEGEDSSHLPPRNASAATLQPNTSVSTTDRGIAGGGGGLSPDSSGALSPEDLNASSSPMVMPETEFELKAEVSRCWAILKEHGINPRTGRRYSSPTRDIGVAQPFRAVEPPIISTSAPASRAEVGQINVSPVYYTSEPPKLGWFEWLGIGSSSSQQREKGNQTPLKKTPEVKKSSAPSSPSPDTSPAKPSSSATSALAPAQEPATPPTAVAAPAPAPAPAQPAAMAGSIPIPTPTPVSDNNGAVSSPTQGGKLPYPRPTLPAPTPGPAGYTSSSSGRTVSI